MKSWGLTANLSEFSVKLCTFNKLQQFLNLSQYTGGGCQIDFFPHPFKTQKKVNESILHKHQYSLFPEYPLI